MIEDAKEELKRADHLVFVSLKYTRTIDVIESIIKRLLNASQIAMDSLIDYYISKKKIKERPISFKNQIEVLKKLVKNDELKEFLDFSVFLFRIDKAEHIKKEEFRKNVALIAVENGDVIAEASINMLKEYYKKTEDFINFIFNFVKGIKNE